MISLKVLAFCKVAKGQSVRGDGKGRLAHTGAEEHLLKTGACAEVGAIKPPHPWENLPRDLGGLCTQLEDRH